MASAPVASLGRDLTEARLRQFVDAFRDPSLLVGATGLPEAEKFDLVPLVFGLLPRKTLVRGSSTEPVKPAISAFLRALGVTPSEELVEVLKAIADQYVDSGTRAGRNRKWTISVLRARRPDVYASLRSRQRDRCALCGVPFDEVMETLDHIIPWRVGGDRTENYQLLCELCNNSKAHFFSALQAAEATAWVYGDTLTSRSPTGIGRYVALAWYRGCQSSGCTARPDSARLFVYGGRADGLPTGGNLAVVCDAHRPTEAFCC